VTIIIVYLRDKQQRLLLRNGGKMTDPDDYCDIVNQAFTEEINENPYSYDFLDDEDDMPYDDWTYSVWCD
tara:strand:- start:288 stop:497 length:210 start_codon:yes stop_codon:yes gene_type:complete